MSREKIGHTNKIHYSLGYCGRRYSDNDDWVFVGQGYPNEPEAAKK